MSPISTPRDRTKSRPRPLLRSGREGLILLWLVLAMFGLDLPKAHSYERIIGEGCASMEVAPAELEEGCCCGVEEPSMPASCPMMDEVEASVLDSEEAGCECALVPTNDSSGLGLDLLLLDSLSGGRSADRLDAQQRISARTPLVGLVGFPSTPELRSGTHPIGLKPTSGIGSTEPPGSLTQVRWTQGGAARFLAEISSLLI